MWNLCWVYEQLLGIISWYGFGIIDIRFRLFFWPRMESLLYPTYLIFPLLVALFIKVSFDPRFFMYNILGNYK